MSQIKLYGSINKGGHPIVSRSVQRAENCTMEVQILGKYNDLEDIVINKDIGDDAGILSRNTEGDSFMGYKIKTLSVSREEGEIGILSASLVKASSLTKPFHVTYTVDMIEDQRPLLRHPYFSKDPESKETREVLTEIRLWMDTDPGVRIHVNSEGAYDFKYLVWDNGLQKSYLKSVSKDKAFKYCLAYVAGIEHYNVYLPVVTKVSLYLKEPPGGSQNKDTHELSGTVEFSNTIGKWDDDLDFTIKGYEDNANQGWFKSQDSYTQNSDGTWQRNEQWTFSDSKTHKWIYEEA